MNIQSIKTMFEQSVNSLLMHVIDFVPTAMHTGIYARIYDKSRKGIDYFLKLDFRSYLQTCSHIFCYICNTGLTCQ